MRNRRPRGKLTPINNGVKIVGIDYSLCSPCVAVTTDGGLSYQAHYLTSTKKFLGDFKFGNFLIKGWEYPAWTTPEERYQGLSEWAIRLAGASDQVMIEDYALGAKGRVFHIGENAGLLKWKLWNLKIPFSVVGPTVLKKWATGKGNADKEKMHAAFQQRFGVDMQARLAGREGKIGNPVSDVVDAVWLAAYGTQHTITRT
jgi:Holliday junction resolvasome RuvABC endonuclease subunit